MILLRKGFFAEMFKQQQNDLKNLNLYLYNKKIFLNLLSKMENVTKKENLYSLYEAYQKYQANKIDVKAKFSETLNENYSEVYFNEK